MRYFGLPELGMIEMKRCDIKTHIHSPIRGLIKKVSCDVLVGDLGCKKCHKVNSKRIKQYVKKHNLDWTDKLRIMQRNKIFC